MILSVETAKRREKTYIVVQAPLSVKNGHFGQNLVFFLHRKPAVKWIFESNPINFNGAFTLYDILLTYIKPK